MKDILKDSIKMHYDNKDYTEVVRDAILCLMNEIRKKSDLQDNDGVDLINKAFSENTPLIKINKMQTQTEKNKHRGITDLSKGIVEYFRNPMSHEKQSYSKEVADALLTIIDKIILEEIIQSKSLNSIEEWYSEIISELCPNTERYAQNLANIIPENKIYELVVQMYKNRKEIKNEKIKIISELVKKMKEDEFIEYCSIIEGDIFGKNSEEDLINILRFISKEVFNNFKNLSKIKIEDMVFEDIKKCEVYSNEDTSNFDIIQNYGNIIIGAKHLIKFFSNKEEIAKCIYEKLVDSRNNEYQFYFIIENFFDIITEETTPQRDIINRINDRLRYINRPIWYEIFKENLKKLPSDNKWHKKFEISFGIFIPNDDELPF